MSKVLINDTTLVAIGDAIREKNGTTDTYKPSEMPAAILSISGSSDGDTTIEDDLIQKTVSGTYTNNRVTTVGYGIFANCSNLNAVSMQNVTSIDSYGFYHCYNLNTINMPNVTTIGKQAFYGCTALSTPFETMFPNVISVGENAFQRSSLTTLESSTLTTIEEEAFHDCDNLTTVDLPNATSIGTYAFYACNKLTTVILPNVTNIEEHIFQSCDALNTVDITNATTIKGYAFYGSGITSLILRKTDTIVTLSGVITYTFRNTPIASGTGYIYVPSALIDTYKADSKWTTYTDQFRALEDYTVDGTTTGALDETKI